jgi:hypothetical protein
MAVARQGMNLDLTTNPTNLLRRSAMMTKSTLALIATLFTAAAAQAGNDPTNPLDPAHYVGHASVSAPTTFSGKLASNNPLDPAYGVARGQWQGAAAVSGGQSVDRNNPLYPFFSRP